VLNITQSEAQSEDQEVFPVSTPGALTGTGAEGSEDRQTHAPDLAGGVGRRIYARLNTKVNVSYRLVKSKEKLSRIQTDQFSTTENLGAGGILLVADTPIAISSILELKLELPDAGKPIECLGKVLRVEEVDPEKSYKLAICFLDIPSSERTRLKKYVEEEIT
jgi:c-di-GMP-binding flagellar brake protein YcgR